MNDQFHHNTENIYYSILELKGLQERKAELLASDVDARALAIAITHLESGYLWLQQSTR